jgi:hypothetical protein
MFRLAAALAALLLIARPAGAGTSQGVTSEDATSQDTTAAFSLPAFLRQITDTAGFRSRLEQDGVKFTFSYYGDAFANPTGGVKQGPGYDGRFGTIIDADLQKLIGWSGATVHASIHQIHGTQFSAVNLDNLMLVSGIEAPTSTRLFNLWIEQQFANQLNLRVGQFTAAQEFMVSDNADLFVNSTFGWPLLASADLPSGGPNYPEATPGARLQIAVTDHLTFRAAIFDGNPAGPGAGNPVFRDPYGLAFRISDPPFFIAEFEYEHGQAGPGAVAVDRNQEGDFLRQRRRAPRRREGRCPAPSISGPGSIPAHFPISASTRRRAARGRWRLAAPASGQRRGLWRHRPDAVARPRPRRSGAQRFHARNGGAGRPQSDRRLCRRRLHLQRPAGAAH